MSVATKSVRRNRGDATHDLYWRANLPGLGGSMFFVRQSERGSHRSTSALSKEYVPTTDDDFTIENEVYNAVEPL